MWEDSLVSVAVFILWWWLAFMAMLPMGVRNLDEAGVDARGHERGAPATPQLKKKAMWALAIAAVLWAITAGVLQVLYYGR
jgi:predicted secreted protein